MHERTPSEQVEFGSTLKIICNSEDKVITSQSKQENITATLKWSDLTQVEYLTITSNSLVYTALLNQKPVVVKKMNPNNCESIKTSIKESKAEISLHSQLDHPNIVKYIGSGITLKRHPFIVLEHLSGGNLSEIIERYSSLDRKRRFVHRKVITMTKALMYARDIADALAYCHGMAIKGSIIMHRDLKPDNICFTSQGKAKLIDFGLAHVIDNATPYCDQVHKMTRAGSLRYMAPEVVEKKPYNHKADVYSFGIILWALLTCKKPYGDLDSDCFIDKIVKGNVRPPLNKKWPQKLSKLMIHCWSPVIEERPNFDEIVRLLDSLITSDMFQSKMLVTDQMILF